MLKIESYVPLVTALMHMFQAAHRDRYAQESKQTINPHPIHEKLKEMEAVCGIKRAYYILAAAIHYYVSERDHKGYRIVFDDLFDPKYDWVLNQCIDASRAKFIEVYRDSLNN